MPRFPKKKLLWLKMDETYDKITFLLKYAPKYYTKVEFEASEVMRYPIQSKIKRIKVIKQVSVTECTEAESGAILGILKAKNKQIKIFDGVKSHLLQNFPVLESYKLRMQDLVSWRVFLRSLHLESLEVESSRLLYFQNKRHHSPIIINYLKSRFWTYVEKLSKINKFQLHVNNFIDDPLIDFLQRFSKLQTRLQSVKSFVCTFNYVGNLAEYNPDFSNIFPYVTVLKTHELSYQSQKKLLMNLPSCKNLKSLRILKVMPDNNGAGNDDRSFNYFNRLVELVKLQALDLSINLGSYEATLSFFESLCLPKSIKNIALDLHEVNWSALTPMAKICSSDIFKANKICAKFYQKWENLENLIAFNFSLIEEETSHPSLGFFFTLPILQNVQTLSSFYYSNSCEPLYNEQDYTNFHTFWQYLKHLWPKLKTLYLETSEISLRNFSLENNESEFRANLKKLGLCGNAFGDIKLQNLYNLFAKTNLETSQLEIGCVVIQDLRHFERFLEGVTDCPRHIKLSMDVDVGMVTTEDFISAINKYIPRIRPRNLSKVHFTNLKSLERQDLRELKQIFLEYKVLEYIQVSDQKGRRLQVSNDLDLLNHASPDSDDDDSFFSAAEIEDDDDFMA